MLLALLLILHTTQPCQDVASCKSAALEAYAQKDFERFHDLAWVAHRKAGKDDPELLILLARAQSLSGRPLDALVMLERRAKFGAGPSELATDPDFERVRDLAGWDDIRQKLSIGVAGPGLSNSPSTPKTASPPAPRPEPPPVAKPEPPAPKPAPARPAGAPLSFTTLLSPTALAYDGVSKRYLIADRQAKRVAVVDENTGQVSTLAGGQAKLGEINGIAIDTRQGDLWVISTADEGASLHRLQLISGREIGASRLSGLHAPVVGVAFVRGTGIVIADANGDISRVATNGRVEKIGSLEYVPRAIAADAEGTLYVAAGGPRLAKFSVVPTLRRLAVVDLPSGMPADANFTVVGDQVRYVLPVNGAYEIRK